MRRHWPLDPSRLFNPIYHPHHDVVSQAGRIVRVRHDNEGGAALEQIGPSGSVALGWEVAKHLADGRPALKSTASTRLIPENRRPPKIVEIIVAAMAPFDTDLRRRYRDNLHKKRREGSSETCLQRSAKLDHLGWSHTNRRMF